MTPALRRSIGSLAIFAVMGVIGCDAGGLIEVEDKDPDAPPRVTQGHPSTEFVSGGTQVSNGKHKLIYTMGQPTPQGVTKRPEGHRLNGGMPGSTQAP